MKFKLIIDTEKDEEVVVTAHQNSTLIKQIESLVMQHSGTDKLVAYTEDDIVIIPFKEIECIAVENSKTWLINNAGKRFKVKQRLYELEKILPSNFIKINKSSLANENCIKKFTASFSGAVDVVFTCGYKDYVSRRCFAEIKRRYDI